MRLALLLAILLALSACSSKSEEPVAAGAPPAPMAAAPRAHAGAPLAKAERSQQAPSADAGAAADATVRRYLAVRHELHLLTAADGVEAAWKTATDACNAAGCEVLNASISRDDERRPAGALLEARVPPAALAAFLAQVTALGTVGQHSTRSEDKTDEVIDTEAKQKNTAEFRDNLRKLMATPNAKLKDLIEVERELTRVQSELDSLATRRKLLAQQTEKVHVTLQFSARPSVLDGGAWSPVKQALQRTGHVLAGSIAVMIEVIVALLPWALVLAAAFFGLRVLWRRKSRRAATPPV